MEGTLEGRKQRRWHSVNNKKSNNEPDRKNKTRTKNRFSFQCNQRKGKALALEPEARKLNLSGSNCIGLIYLYWLSPAQWMTNYPCLRLINNNSAVTACAQSNQGAWLCSQYTDGYVPNECVYFATVEKEAAVSPRVWWSAKLNPVKGLQKGNTDSVLRWYWSISVAKELCALQSEQHIAWMNMGYDSLSTTVKIKIVIQLFIKLNVSVQWLRLNF